MDQDLIIDNVSILKTSERQEPCQKHDLYERSKSNDEKDKEENGMSCNRCNSQEDLLKVEDIPIQNQDVISQSSRFEESQIARSIDDGDASSCSH